MIWDLIRGTAPPWIGRAGAAEPDAARGLRAQPGERLSYRNELGFHIDPFEKSPTVPPRLVYEDPPVHHEDDATRENAEFAFVCGQGKYIEGDVDCRGFSGACRQVERGGPPWSASTRSASRLCQR